MSATVGVYGKIPAQADFVRVNAGELSRLGLDRWFQEAHEVVHGERGRLPEEPVFFVLSPAGARIAVLGALAPSQDAVGRVFPLVVFATADAPPLTDAFPLLPMTYRSFFDAAAALLEGIASVTTAELGARVQAVAAAMAPDRPADVGGQLSAERVSPLGLALGGLPHGAAYALRTVLTACDRSRAAPATPTNVTTVDAPAPTDATRLFWLELIRRRLGWRDALPSFLWTRRDSTRLLVTIGPPAPAVLAFLANPRHKSGRFWPLRTEVDSALESAFAGLAPEQRNVLESPGASLADVLGVFGVKGLALAAVLLSGCGLVGFDIEQPIPEQVVRGSPLGALLPAGLFQLPLQVDLESSTKAMGTGPASAAYLKSLTLTVTDPTGETFAFLDSITINVSSAGQPERKIAALMPVPKQGRIELKPEPNVDLLPYIKSGATLGASAAGRTPARDIKFNGRVVVTIKV